MQIKPYIRKPFYYETDQMQVVHHSNYIRWFEEARLYFLDQIGFPYEKIEEMGILIPVLSVTSNFHEFAKYDEEVRIEIAITHFNGVRMNIDYNIYNNKTNKLINTGSSSHCFLDKEYKVVRLKKYLPDLYEALLKHLKK